jgi:hypothetical protein
MTLGDRPRALIFATKPIPAQQEITFDYKVCLLDFQLFSDRFELQVLV